ncbi:hypothetical protein AA313_de0201710 [Arthrobotrys entomopaga]|nr:hypothetical protein AA313_de0201710 [Arthrobotrys entomopaga]
MLSGTNNKHDFSNLYIFYMMNLSSVPVTRCCFRGWHGSLDHGLHCLHHLGVLACARNYDTDGARVGECRATRTSRVDCCRSTSRPGCEGCDRLPNTGCWDCRSRRSSRRRMQLFPFAGA